MGHRAFFVGCTRHLGVEEGIEAVVWCSEGAFRGVFGALVRPRTPPGRKSVFLYANFPFKKPRKTRGFRSPEKT